VEDEDECERTKLSTPTPDSTDKLQVEPKSYPEIPSELSKTTASDFATSYEKAYTWNQTLIKNGSKVRNINFKIWYDSKVEPQNTGFWVVFDVQIGYTTKNSEADNEYTIVYYVSSNRIHRDKNDYSEQLRPNELDHVIYCS
jgi:hypothetical protein